jgi:hypothetical protein
MQLKALINKQQNMCWYSDVIPCGVAKISETLEDEKRTELSALRFTLDS